MKYDLLQCVRVNVDKLLAEGAIHSGTTEKEINTLRSARGLVTGTYETKACQCPSCVENGLPPAFVEIVWNDREVTAMDSGDLLPARLA